jgi:4-amino-4-deoxy-L-arabinose transferase-like glycosyltransferase
MFRHREKIVLAITTAVILFLVFYNLGNTPRSWHDEGASLLVAKTLAEDGVYGSKNGGEYETFGPIQSVGPTVLLPVAAAFKLFGVGLLPGRGVAAVYTLLTLLLFYLTGRALFGKLAAWLGLFFLLASPAVGFLVYGRQLLGEVPAFAFFLLAFLAWLKGLRSGRRAFYVVAGLALGAAMITKSQYVLMVAGTLFFLVIADRFYYRQQNGKWLILVGILAYGCFFAWVGWQYGYFGAETFGENAAALQQLAASTTGFHLPSVKEALKFLLGEGSGYLYFYWGILAFLYVGFLSLRRSKEGLSLAFLCLLVLLWLAYFAFWIIPWRNYALPPLSLLALFVGKLFADLASGLYTSRGEFKQQLASYTRGGGSLNAQTLLSLGTLVALITMLVLTLFQFQQIIAASVLNVEGHYIASVLNEIVDEDAVIETWERELGILTGHYYHYPAQTKLVQTHPAVFRQELGEDYSLGESYMQSVGATYLVIGWFGRWTGIYNEDFLSDHGELVATVGVGDWRYEVYELKER